MTFIDVANFLEKRDLLPSSYRWKDARELRNYLTHEYPNEPDIVAKNLNDCPEYIKELLDYWQFLRVKTLEMISQYEQQS